MSRPSLGTVLMPPMAGTVRVGDADPATVATFLGRTYGTVRHGNRMLIVAVLTAREGFAWASVNEIRDVMGTSLMRN